MAELLYTGSTVVPWKPHIWGECRYTYIHLFTADDTKERYGQFRERRLMGTTDPSICLVHYDKQNKRIHTDHTALKLLRGLDKHVAVLGICGPYRSGKSFFVSQVMKSADFKVGHSIRPCTKGIWMASNVLESKDFVIIVLDTEGIGAAQASEASSKDEVMKYLIITTLLCSYLIYNAKGVIEQSHLLQMR